MAKGLQTRLRLYLEGQQAEKILTIEEVIKAVPRFTRSSYSSAMTTMVKMGEVERLGIGMYRVLAPARVHSTGNGGATKNIILHAWKEHHGMIVLTLMVDGKPVSVVVDADQL